MTGAAGNERRGFLRARPILFGALAGAVALAVAYAAYLLLGIAYGSVFVLLVPVAIGLIVRWRATPARVRHDRDV